MIRAGIFGRAIGLAIAVLALAVPASALAKGYKLKSTWQVDGGGMTVTKAGVFVLANDGVVRYSTAGKRRGGWSDQVGASKAITADQAGNLYVLAGGDVISEEADYLTKFNSHGGVLDKDSITIEGENAYIFDAEVDPKGDLYLGHAGVGIFDEFPPGVLRFTGSGQPLASWGSEGVGNGQFGGGIYLASDGKGKVYVADRDNDRIERFTDSGDYVGQWGQSGTGPGQFIEPNAVAIDKKGAVYVGDAINPRVQKFSPSGKLLDTIAIPLDSQKSSPDAILDIDLEAKGNLYVLENEDTYGTRYGSVYVFAPN